MTAADADARPWAPLAPTVPAEWFVHQSALHGERHTQRVHIHARRLAGELGWAQPDTRLVLSATLWHDIGRTHDGVEPQHGAASAARAVELGLAYGLASADADIALFAIRNHSLPDVTGEEEAERLAGARRLAEPERALRILWLLKDADGLDRVRLGAWEAPDAAQLRSPCAAGSIGFAWELLAALG